MKKFKRFAVNATKKLQTSAGRIRFGIMLFASLVIWMGCNREDYCSDSDFIAMDKIDAHCHINTRTHFFLEQAVKDHFRIITINTDAPVLVSIHEQQDIAIQQGSAYAGRVGYLTTFSMKEWGQEGWPDEAREYILESMNKGALGVKIWKNIGMVEKDGTGSFIMVDDPGFDPLLDFLEENSIPVCGHLGEPRNCWLPIGEMTVNNDRAYYQEHPQYHMYLHPEYPSYEQQIEARDHMLSRHPDLRFMGAHLASLEWSLDELGRFLDRFPNASVDMAARICYLQLHAQKDPRQVRDFMIKYQDRIIYGTDMGDFGEIINDPERMTATMHKTWKNDWKFLTTDEPMTADEIEGEFRGIRLPKKVVEKIYYQNAEKMFPGI